MVSKQKFEMNADAPRVGRGTSRMLYLVILSVVFMIGLFLSMAFPFGMGVMLFLLLLVLTGALGAVGITCVKLFRDMLGPSISFGYKPSEAYLAGRKHSSAEKDEGQETRSEEQ